MKTFQLSAQTRDGIGKRVAKNLRKEGLVPAVMYGGEEVIHLSVKEADLRNLIYTPEIYLIELDVDGTVYKSIMQEVQFHPVSDHVLHIDFLQVFDEKPIVIEVPVTLEGLAAGVRAGGKLSLDMRKLRVRGLYTDIPERLHINVTKLKLGQTIQVGDLSFDKIELLNGKNAVVAAVRATRVSLSGTGDEEDEEGEESEEGAEGEEAAAEKAAE